VARRLFCVAAGVGLCAGASGQSLNVDFGDEAGVPPPTYAGMGLAGVWNHHPGGHDVHKLVGLSGQPTDVTVRLLPEVAPGPNGKWSFGFDHPQTTGGDEALLDDAVGDLVDIVGTLTFSNLEDGTYTVYTHSWVAYDPQNIAWVWVNDEPHQVIGGPWPGQPTHLVTTAIHQVKPEKGQIRVQMVRGTILYLTTWWLNGVQLVKEGTCYPDCDGSGSLDLFDFLCFANAFNVGDPYADCDGSGGLDLFDFLCFTNAFNAGCP